MRDPSGRLERAEGPSGSVRYTYDCLGRISGTDTDLLRTEYTYDARGRITQARAINAGSPVGDFRYTYDPNGNLLTIEKADQSTEHRSYDARNRLTKIAAGQKQLAEYRYDPSGDLLYAREGFWGEETELFYEYDTAHRLIQEQRRRGDRSSLRRFSYDARGNLIGEESENAVGEKVSLSYRYNLADQLLQKGEESYRYDARGNLIRAEGVGESRIYESDARNRIVRVKTAAGETQYSYDALNHLIGETRYEEGSAGLYSNYHMYSLTKDRLYSTRTIRSEAGETVLAADYCAWGEPLFAYVKGEHAGGVLGEASYTGHVYGSISGLYYAKARMYSPEDKRFISSDPGRDGLNWYAYCRNNPLRYVDPDGRAAIRWPLSTPLPRVESLPTIKELLAILHEMSAADGPLPAGDAAGLAVVGIGALGIGVVWTANQVFYDPATMPEEKSGLVPYPVMTPEGKGGLIPYPVMTPTEGNAIPSPLVPPQAGKNLLSNPLIPPQTGENLLPKPLIPPQAIPNQGIGGTLNPNIYMQKGGCEGDSDSKKNKIPDNDSTTGHIFRNAEGHLPDTPENRALLEDVANDSANFRGTDKYGNEWYTKTQSDGSQVWVESRNGNIFEGGVNNTPKLWNPETGLKKL